MRRFTKEHIENLRKAHLGVKLSSEHRVKVIKTLHPIKKGQTYEEAFGFVVAQRMKEKMRFAKLGKKMPWNSVPSRKGSAHPRWIRDRTKVKLDKERGGPLHKQWSKSVRERDYWKCKMENNFCLGKLVAHHILPWKDYPELRYIINNGITLCHAHHPRSRAEEQELVPLFRELIGT